MSNQYETTEYRGINYAGIASSANKDTDSGLRYGVLPMNEVVQAWCDESESQCFPYCDVCYNEIDDDGGELFSHTCKVVVDNPDWGEPYAHTVDKDGYKARSGDSGDIFVFESPYFTYAQFCSPCAPGACHLQSPLAEDDKHEDNRAYCLGHDWFEDGKAPDPVYSVKTGERVNPE